jgi:hypothetical protein
MAAVVLVRKPIIYKAKSVQHEEAGALGTFAADESNLITKRILMVVVLNLIMVECVALLLLIL